MCVIMFYRKDLANIVRRRGYKLIRELVSNSTKSDSDGPNPKKSLDRNQDEIGDHEHILTGQYLLLFNLLEFSLQFISALIDYLFYFKRPGQER